MKKQRGVALITVMMVVAIVALIAAEMGGRLQLQVSRELNLLNNQQAQWYAIGGEAFIVRLLAQSLRSDSDTTHLGQIWASDEQYFPVPGGTIGGKVTDLQGCFNINSLRTYKNQEEAKAVRDPFQRLVESLQLEDVSPFEAEALSSALQDWVDENDYPSSNGGAEDSTYAGYEFPYLPANNYMVSLSELRLVEGFTAEIVTQLVPYVCVLPEQGQLRINVNTVPLDKPEILAAVFEGLTVNDAREILNGRPDKGFKDIDEVMALPVLASVSEQSKKDAMKLLVVKSNWFASELETRFNGSRFVLRSVINVTDDNNIRVVSRRIGELL